jgi:hypothetical protein
LRTWCNGLEKGVALAMAGMGLEGEVVVVAKADAMVAYALEEEVEVAKMNGLADVELICS